ncbi:MAG TPA: Cna B-type domain-containing protein, partial [Bacillota bacterium]|nr:Cna B-type domain-containing protein [Bacillota bacterium]
TGETELVIEKVWENDESDDRPLSIMGDILQNGEEYSTFRITAEDDWILTVTDLPEFDEDGEPYEYTVVEHEVDSYESEITETKEGFTITNTYTPDESGNGLPKTATNMYNFLFLGGVILLLGLIILGYTRRRA